MEPISIQEAHRGRSRNREAFHAAAVVYAEACLRVEREHKVANVFDHVRSRERFLNAYKLMVSE